MLQRYVSYKGLTGPTGSLWFSWDFNSPIPASVPLAYFSLYFLERCMLVVVSRDLEQHDLHVIQQSLKLIPYCSHTVDGDRSVMNLGHGKKFPFLSCACRETALTVTHLFSS